MEIRDLNSDERLALAGLVKTVVLSDRNVSDDEIDEIHKIARELGDDAYQSALDTFESRFPDEKSFKEFLLTIQRPDARDLIYGSILEGAAGDAIEGEESELLAWLASAWKIQVVTAE